MLTTSAAKPRVVVGGSGGGGGKSTVSMPTTRTVVLGISNTTHCHTVQRILETLAVLEGNTLRRTRGKAQVESDMQEKPGHIERKGLEAKPVAQRLRCKLRNNKVLEGRRVDELAPSEAWVGIIAFSVREHNQCDGDEWQHCETKFEEARTTK